MSRPGQSNGGFRPQEIQRRKFQEAAAITIDKQAVAIQKTREFVADLSVAIDGLRQVVNTLRQDVDALAARPTAWARLRWLLTGR